MAIFPPINVFAKSPRQIAREAEARDNPKPVRKGRLPHKPSKADREALRSLAEKRPLLDGANFAASLRRGQIERQLHTKRRGPSENSEIKRAGTAAVKAPYSAGA